MTRTLIYAVAEQEDTFTRIVTNESFAVIKREVDICNERLGHKKYCVVAWLHSEEFECPMYVGETWRELDPLKVLGGPKAMDLEQKLAPGAGIVAAAFEYADNYSAQYGPLDDETYVAIFNTHFKWLMQKLANNSPTTDEIVAWRHDPARR